MKLLIDTHTLIWAVDQPTQLSPLAQAAIVDPSNECYFSMASSWEMAIKIGLGKLTLSMPLRPWLRKAFQDLFVGLLSIRLDHVEAVATLPHHHRNPLWLVYRHWQRIKELAIDLILRFSADQQLL